MDAYSRGIFPWYEQGQPVLWWSPSHRAVLAPGQEHIARSLRKRLRQGGFTFTTDRAFERVISACASPRPYASGTWITPAMIRAYTRLHQLGHAHSLECWLDDELVGGLYGIQVGGLFCGESMFSTRDNASKAAFIVLARTLFQSGFGLIDCQLDNPHLASLGAGTVPRSDFLGSLSLLKSQRVPWPDQSVFDTTSAMLQGSNGEER